MQKITVIDYGINNLESIKMALDCLGFKALATSDPKEMAKRDPNAYVEKEEEVPGLKMN